MLVSLNASLEPYNGSRSQKSYNNIRRMLSVVYFHCKTIRNANFEKSRSNIRILMLERVWPAGGQQAKDQEGQTTGVVHPRGM